MVLLRKQHILDKKLCVYWLCDPKLLVFNNTNYRHILVAIIMINDTLSMIYMCNNEKMIIARTCEKPSTFVFINKHKIKIIPIAKDYCVIP